MSPIIEKKPTCIEQTTFGLETLSKFTNMFIAKTKEVKNCIIQAFDIDINNPTAQITWDQYIQLKCFMQFFSLPQDMLQRVWIKILDPKSIRHLNRFKFQLFLEQLARGTVNKEMTLISKAYAINIIQLLEHEGCI